MNIYHFLAHPSNVGACRPQYKRAHIQCVATSAGWPMCRFYTLMILSQIWTRTCVEFHRQFPCNPICYNFYIREYERVGLNHLLIITRRLHLLYRHIVSSCPCLEAIVEEAAEGAVAARTRRQSLRAQSQVS